jgi:CRISPR-associated endonuclease/helicase Cas3
MLLAHSPNAEGVPQGLVEHLQNVSMIAAGFGRVFGAEELCALAGLWHDVGKADPAWQRYLAESHAGRARPGSGPDHKAAGARLAVDAKQELVALLIHAHHGGLQAPAEFKRWLTEKQDLAGVRAARDALQREWPAIAGAAIPAPPRIVDPLRAEVFLRLAYSALVDADTLDTVRHKAGSTASVAMPAVSMVELWTRFERFQRATPRGDGPVNQVREEVLTACIAAAEAEPGLFRLTVPTGGGKTRSGMAFALRHALAHGFRRIVVAVPFLTITEQTASQYRQIFEGASGSNPPVVLEHHSAAAETVGGDDGFGEADLWRRLAAENWDAPIIVTTTVQLFESLFSNRRNRMRKLHRLAGSVIILDEAQALPAGLLDPILDALKQLTTHFNASVVLSTATQPAFEAIAAFAGVNAREIVPDNRRHFEALKRVTYEWRTEGRHGWDEVARWMAVEPACMTVVNTRRHAHELLASLDDPDALHLSTLLCGAHRRATLAAIRERLLNGAPCRLVATQVVEAGVDIDFPAVFRAVAPLDSIIQAAGRCNREGRLESGRVVVFRPPDDAMPPGQYRTGAGLAEVVAADPAFDPGMPEAVARYSRLLFGATETDSKKIQESRRGFNFPEVAEKFRMIDEDTCDVLVPYGEPPERAAVEYALQAIREHRGDPRLHYRALQPYLVSIRRGEADRHRAVGFMEAEETVPGVSRWLGRYDDVIGLVADDASYLA